jgi:hypothetical protein
MDGEARKSKSFNTQIAFQLRQLLEGKHETKFDV